MKLPFPEKIPFSTKEDGTLESDWFLVKDKHGKLYRTQIRMKWEHTCIKDDGGTPNRRCYACEDEKEADESRD